MPEALVASILPESLGPYLVTMLAGFAIGIYGHAMKSRLVVAIGIALVFLATALLPLALNVLSDEPPPPGPRVPQISQVTLRLPAAGCCTLAREGSSRCRCPCRIERTSRIPMPARPRGGCVR